MFSSTSRPRFLRFASAAVLFSGISTLPAHAVSKEIIQLQTQVQQLQDAVARLQQSNDERMGVLRDLVQQTTDTVNKMSVAVNGLQLRLQNQQDAVGSKSDQLSGQMQALNDSLDEMKTRIARMEKSLGDVQGQLQTANGVLANMPQPGGGSPTPLTPATGTPAGTAPVGAPTPAPSATGPAADVLYRRAYSDYMAGNYPVAAPEFSDLIKAYPDDNLSGNAYFYMGEMAMKNGKPSSAVTAYDRVLEHYPDNNKVPAAHLHKAEALIALKQREQAARELRSLVGRFPNSPEAAQARTRLAALNGPAARR